ncbi:hypothetical protein Poli38472_004079 [Pythium oligandrum]|uniref:Temptin Cys/Cys disulfide domain-containing protein n=1 Tax=Pythium oligandrum TaxID=41045 RepID=A0A8K1FMI5_PYTOL|nr:hypothetical protein Poli38472_004079 [Pythium oligandrum]|eukprot:TMW66314.1 hypothetical protein Poli38472_004079 [Pythium oligandrum]
MNLRFLALVGTALLAAAPSIDAYKSFLAKIPNGATVETATGMLGHVTTKERNDFGKAFATAGKEWTEELCKADSDGDGQTNGEELGDPCCVWTGEGEPAMTAGSTDPGDAEAMLSKAELKTRQATCAAGGSDTEETEAPAPASDEGSAPAEEEEETDAPPATVKPSKNADDDLETSASDESSGSEDGSLEDVPTNSPKSKKPTPTPSAASHIALASSCMVVVGAIAALEL